MTIKTRARRGMALILALGVLAVLALLARRILFSFLLRPLWRGGGHGLYKK